MKNGRTMFTRRNFLLAGGAIAFAAGTGLTFLRKKLPKLPGAIVGANAKAGHLLRAGKFPPPAEEFSVETVIVGGGISGLSAGWWLERNKHTDFRILELDRNVGGNSQSGQNEVTAYPWGAHYLPIPSEESVYVREFLKETGVITGSENGQPLYHELYLCSDPDERVFFQGRWHEGLLPQHGISGEEKKHYAEFFAFMKEHSSRKGSDGRRAFAIPLDESSRDPSILKLDEISMASLMDENGWTSPTLRWYVDYCMQDDYGLRAEKVSAWAGIHYFASRSGKAANAERETVLTWPEGNGWLVKQLAQKLDKHIVPDSVVHKIVKENDHYLVSAYSPETKTTKRYRARNVIYAAPRFTARYVFEGLPEITRPDAAFTPWVVANLTLKKLPEGKGHDISWDNVSFYSKSLGYIVATHQSLKRATGPSVITYYLPLTDEAPDTARRHAYTKDHSHWAKLIIDDLEKLHPGITNDITHTDVWVWGHGMVGPTPGYIWGQNRRDMQKSLGRIHFAHSEMSGISIFEEAQYQGVLAAKKVLG